MDEITGATAASDHDQLAALMESFVERFRRGDRDLITQYVARHPNLEDKIRDLFPALALLEGLPVGKPPEGSTGTDASSVPQVEGMASKLGEFRIVREIGRGGMGVVYEAIQETLGRRVALKVLPFHQLLDPRSLERFRREAQATALLQHPSIVSVYGVGEERGIHYYVMQLISGQPLDQVLDQVKRRWEVDHAPQPRSSPSETEDVGSSAVAWLLGDHRHNERLPRESDMQYYGSVASIGAQAAEALADAHSHGVLHRDIKPANLILDSKGSIWVTDFGLASTEDEDSLTRTGDIVGTLRYMAPERFQGWADPRTDIYGLGLTLYELLTLRPAFADSDRSRLIRRITEEDPPSPRRLRRAVPADLETIVLKAIAKEPSRRYATAREMADDLNRFLRGEPVKARPLSIRGRLWLWCRRKPVVASLSTAVAGLVLAVAVVSTIGYIQTARARDNEATQRRAAQANLYLSLVREARTLRVGRLEGYRDRAWALLEQARGLETPEADLAALRQEAVDCMGDFLGLKPVVVTDLGGRISSVMVHSDLPWIIEGMEDGGVHIREAETGVRIARVGSHPAPVSVTDLSRDGTLAASGDERGTVKLWRLREGAEWTPWKSIETGGGRLTMAAFGKDARSLIVGTKGGPLSLWDIEAGAKTLEFLHGEVELRGISTSRDGSRVASGYTERGGTGLLVWDGRTAALRKRLPTSLGYPYSSAVSDDGGHLAGGFEEGIEVYDMGSFERIGFVRNTRVFWTAFDPRSSNVAYLAHDFVELWNLMANQEVAQLSHPARRSAAWGGYSAAGRMLVSADADTLRIWRVAPASERLPLGGHDGGVTDAVFSPDGRLLASAGKDRTVRLWNVSTGDLEGVISGFQGPVQSVVFSPDGRTLATGDWAGELRTWSVTSREERSRESLTLGDIWRVAYSLDGRTFTACGDRGLLAWRTAPEAGDGANIGQGIASREPLLTWTETGVRDARFSKEGKLLAFVTSGTDGRRIRVYELEERRHLDFPTPRLLGSNNVLAFLPQERLLFVTAERRAEVWDARVGKRLYSLGESGSIGHEHVNVSADGAWLLTFAPEIRIAIWDLAARRSSLVLRPERRGFWCTAWSPTEERIAVGLNDGSLHIWDLAQVRAQLARLKLDGNNAEAGGGGDRTR